MYTAEFLIFAPMSLLSTGRRVTMSAISMATLRWRNSSTHELTNSQYLSSNLPLQCYLYPCKLFYLEAIATSNPTRSASRNPSSLPALSPPQSEAFSLSTREASTGGSPVPVHIKSSPVCNQCTRNQQNAHKPCE